MVLGWYFVSGLVLRFISPPFGKLTALEQRLEGEYRQCHNELITHSEEVAFYNGSIWEKKKINESFKVLYDHIDSILYKKIFMGIFDSMVVKYGAVCVGYTVLGLPVFGPNRDKYTNMTRETSDITRDYIRNSSLLINLAKAIGRIVVSYKEVQSLAGYTLLVYELKQVLDDLSTGNYERVMVKDSKIDRNGRGNYIEGKMIKFEDVPLVTPNGDLLINAPMNFEI